MNLDVFTFLLVPFLIFCARICDVTIGTLRIILVAKGRKRLAPLLGFFEVLIWIVVISRIMHNLDNWVNYIAYAAGFATGNYIGMIVEEKLAIGLMMVRVVTAKETSGLVKDLQNANYGVTCVDAFGSAGKVQIVYTIAERNDVQQIIDIIYKFSTDAFYSVEDIRYANHGVFPEKKPFINLSFLNFRRWRPGM
jgi:uncharacterized protein YebE (UPF0316 family)